MVQRQTGGEEEGQAEGGALCGRAGRAAAAGGGEATDQAAGAGPVPPDLRPPRPTQHPHHGAAGTDSQGSYTSKRGVGCGGSMGRASASKSNGFHDQRFESRPEHKNNL